MNKEKYLSVLRKELHSNRVEDIEEIIAEYEDHFAHKTADGYSEEEIAARLEKPEIIAKQFVIDSDKPQGANFLTKTSIVLLDIVMGMIDAMLYAFILALGVSAVALCVGGIYMWISGGLSVAPMPVIARVLLGISGIALSVLTGAGTIYYALFVTQLNKAYLHWHKNMMTGHISPAFPTTPKLAGKMKRRLRSVTFISLLVCIVFFVIGYIYMAISAGALGFWHVWHWFA